jgi:hypothetical protein
VSRELTKRPIQEGQSVLSLMFGLGKTPGAFAFTTRLSRRLERPGAVAGPALPRDNCRYAFEKKGGAVFALDLRSIIALHVFVGTAPKALFERPLFHDPAALLRLGFCDIAEEASPVGVGLLFPAAVMLNDCLAATEPIRLVVNGCAKAEG